MLFLAYFMKTLYLTGIHENVVTSSLLVLGQSCKGHSDPGAAHWGQDFLGVLSCASSALVYSLSLWKRPHSVIHIDSCNFFFPPCFVLPERLLAPQICLLLKACLKACYRWQCYCLPCSVRKGSELVNFPSPCF